MRKFSKLFFSKKKNSSSKISSLLHNIGIDTLSYNRNPLSRQTPDCYHIPVYCNLDHISLSNHPLCYNLKSFFIIS